MGAQVGGDDLGQLGRVDGGGVVVIDGSLLLVRRAPDHSRASRGGESRGNSGDQGAGLSPVGRVHTGGMDAGLTIGEFSRITHLSIKTLRRYHEAGLLEPAHVDRQTGYRYYTLDQVPAAQVIHRFRELDMPLREVGELLAVTDPDARAAVIAQHLQRVEHQLDETKAAVVALRRLLDPSPGALEVTAAAGRGHHCRGRAGRRRSRRRPAVVRGRHARARRRARGRRPSPHRSARRPLRQPALHRRAGHDGRLRPRQRPARLGRASNPS